MSIGLLVSVFISGLFYAWYKNKLTYFKRKGIPFLKPRWLLGETVEVLLRRYTPHTLGMKMYNEFPKERIFGFYQFFKPAYFIRDPVLAKQIVITDFEYFTNRPLYMEENGTDLINNSLLFLNGQKWREMRATLTHAYTGSKVKQMSKLVSNCVENMVQHFVERAENGEEIHEDFRSIYSRVFTDVIASCSFGIQLDSFVNKNNEIFLMAQRFLNLNMLKYVALAIAPKMMKLLNVGITDRKVESFFRLLVFETINVRERQNIFRPDMINMILQIRKGKFNTFTLNDGNGNEKQSKIRDWTDNELLAQCFVFFIAGLDSSSIALSSLSYELMLNPEVQDKLYDEIKNAHDQLNGQPINYVSLMKLKYLDACLCETLRKWPVFSKIERQCVKDYYYNDGITKLHIEKGTAVTVPFSAYHYDPQYFPNPEKFDPDRFSDENKENIVPGTFLPFGIGPRLCIGQRFAMMQMKVVVYHLLLKFKFMPNHKTQIPLKIIGNLLAMEFEKGMNLKLERRQT